MLIYVGNSVSVLDVIYTVTLIIQAQVSLDCKLAVTMINIINQYITAIKNIATAG